MRTGVILGSGVTPQQMAFARELRKHMTPAERALWEQLRAHRLDGFRFRRQQVIQGYIADFYCNAARLVIEVDGPVHARQRDYDDLREQAIAAYGLRVLRFTNDEVLRDLPSVLNRIRQLLR